MALPPKFSGQRFIPTEGAGASSFPSQPLHTVEIFLDYTCPFSAKIYNTLYTSLLPALSSDPSLGSKLQFIFRHQVQPWHPSSTLTHEAALAVQRLAPAKFWDFSAALFKDQKAYFDVSLVNETRNETYKRLAKLAADSVGVDENQVYELLKIPTEAKGDNGSLNVGNAVTNDLKVVIKMARLVGVHVSPTVIFDGVVAGDVSSSWSLEQWLEFLRKATA
ncbi:thioredoxin-like protein [Sordaria brevicollis]|uniref:Thioredoxin-like protein n=1 Tax=Sordaria brevicollis TaxID=83679 RepID=A0AAE0PAD6_SORBR|nr:thioredoxin-like protein [Sordaria brevicollis]